MASYFATMRTFAIGLLFGAATLAILEAIFFQDIIKPWQDLTAGILAIVAAIGAFGIGYSQLKLQSDHYEHARRRKYIAAKTALPLVASELMHYAGRCISMLAEIRLQVDKNSWEVATVPQHLVGKMPLIPVDLIPVLKNCVEYADPKSVEALSTLAWKLQVQNARIRDLFTEGVVPEALQHEVKREIKWVTAHSANTYIVDATEIYARASDLLDLARGRVDSIETSPKLSTFQNALASYGIYDHNHPQIWEKVQRDFSP